MPTSNANRANYIGRINRVFDYVEANLSSALSLAELAKVAHFSPYHFHRTFSAITGETLYQFINRVRLERAATHLLVNREKPVTQIALDNGFSSSATFARAFQAKYGMSASQWREGGYEEYSKNRKTVSNHGKTDRKNWKDPDSSGGYIIEDPNGNGAFPHTNSSMIRSDLMKNVSDLQTDVKVRDFQQRTVAYVRHVGPYKGDSELFKGLWERLMAWAGPRGLLQQPDLQCLCVYHDSPEITEESKLRTSVCISVPPKTDVEGEIGKMEIAGGKYAVGHFEINADQYEAAWGFMYGRWLPQSGYQPEDQPSFECCLNNPEEHPEHKHVVDICVPVKPM